MKRIIKKLVSIAICLAMVMAFTVPAFAETSDDQNVLYPSHYVPHDYTMYRNFMRQTDDELGIDNSTALQAALDRLYAEDHGYSFWDFEQDNDISPIFSSGNSTNGAVYINTVEFFGIVNYSYSDGEISYDFCQMEIYPDLCGNLDVTGTLTQTINSPQYDQTHIRSVNVDDCWDLTQLAFNGQRYCRELSALNCPVLRRIEARDCDYRQITVKPMGYDAPLDAVSIGNCSIGMDYSFTGSQEADLYAYPTEELGFIGWFVGGRLVSTETDYIHQGGGKVYACFAGDVNGDGLINIMDANLIMCGSLNLAPMEEEALFDLDSNGIINTADALLAIRVGMGL